jgi:hypothetical protein
LPDLTLRPHHLEILVETFLGSKEVLDIRMSVAPRIVMLLTDNIIIPSINLEDINLVFDLIKKIGLVPFLLHGVVVKSVNTIADVGGNVIISGEIF